MTPRSKNAIQVATDHEKSAGEILEELERFRLSPLGLPAAELVALTQAHATLALSLRLGAAQIPNSGEIRAAVR